MKFLAIGALALLFASSMSIASAEEPSLNDVAPGSGQGGSGKAGAQPPTSQATYTVPVEIREILEQNAAMEAAAAAAAPQPSLPQINARPNN